MNQKSTKYIYSTLRYSLIALLVMCVLLSCTNNKFEYSKQISTYLLNEYKINVKNEKNTIVFFLKNGSCGSCEERTVEFLKRLIVDSKYKNYKFIIHYRQDDRSISMMKELPVQIIVSRGNIIDTYGVILVKDLLIEIKSGDIDYYGWLFRDELDGVINHFFSQ